MNGLIPVAVTIGAHVQLARTVAESDVYLFAGITGDQHPNHIDEEYMRQGRFGARIVHGALLVGFMSAGSTKFLLDNRLDAVSLGYDRLRFVHPVYIGDTVTVIYEIQEVDNDRLRSIAEVRIENQDDDTVAVGRHILRYVR